MPADYHSAAAALSIPTSPSPLPSPIDAEDTTDSARLPPWAQRPNRASTTSSSASAHRLASRPYTLHRAASSSASQQPLLKHVADLALSLANQALRLFLSLSPAYRALALLALAAAGALGVALLIYGERILAALGPAAQAWAQVRFGWVVLWLATAATAFPPMIGYSTATTIAGFVYGFPAGWPVAASASVAGSAAAFVASRGVLAGYVQRLVGGDRRFVAFAQVLRRDGLLMLTMIRLCPLPFSLSNGFLATVPSINVWSFAAGTAFASPKLLVHVFIGDRLRRLAESGDTMSAGTKALNYGSMALGGVLGFAVGVVVYRRTMARAAELAAEDVEAAEDYSDAAAAAAAATDLARAAGVDADAAALMDDDDISLWETQGADDNWDDEEEANGNGVKRP